MNLIVWWATVPALLAILGGLVLFARELRGWSRQAPPHWELPLTPPINAAHRGGDALFPENTLEAFRAAERLGCRMMELDVHASADGVPMVIHDPTVDRTTDGSGPVNAMTLAQLKQLHAAHRFQAADGIISIGGDSWAGRGVRIPTLEEALRDLPQCVFSIDIKQKHPSCEAAVVEVLRRTGSEGRVVLGSKSHAVFLRIHALAPDIPSPFTFRSSFGFYFALWLGLSRWYHPAHSALMVPPSWWGLPLVTRRSVAAAHRLGLPVFVWTIDDAEQMRRLLEMGVDGIVTGRPDLLQEVIGEGGGGKEGSIANSGIVH